MFLGNANVDINFFVCTNKNFFSWANLYLLIFHMKYYTAILYCFIIFNGGFIIMQNSEVIKKVLTTLLKISGRKTTSGHAVYIMDEMINKLRKKYDFLKYVEVNDTRFLEEGDFISIMSDIDSVSNQYMGNAIYDIIVTMNEMLGRDAGHFFIKELSRSIGDDYYSTITSMGVDLSLMQLESEVNEMEKRLLQTRKT
jgi:hypothetical protein